jgi:hypothetical protein
LFSGKCDEENSFLKLFPLAGLTGKGEMKMELDSLLRGAIDMHWHGYPELSLDFKMRMEDLEALKAARDVGMRAVVFKNHMWPTMEKAYHLGKQIKGIDVFGSITLNVSSGGLSPWAVEAAAETGAKVVWFPTWSAANDVQRNSVIRFVRKFYHTIESFPPSELSIIDSHGRVRPEVSSILKVAKDRGMVVFTGHLSGAEGVSLAHEADRIDFRKMVFGHASGPPVNATIEQMKEFVQCGGYVEFTFLVMLPIYQQIHPRKVAEIINDLGSQSCILSSDCYFPWAPPPSEMMRMFLGTMFELGMNESQLVEMVQKNPAKLLYV